MFRANGVCEAVRVCASARRRRRRMRPYPLKRGFAIRVRSAEGALAAHAQGGSSLQSSYTADSRVHKAGARGRALGQAPTTPGATHSKRPQKPASRDLCFFCALLLHVHSRHEVFSADALKAIDSGGFSAGTRCAPRRPGARSMGRHQHHTFRVVRRHRPVGPDTPKKEFFF